MFDQQLLEDHAREFGTSQASAFAPGRVNLIGEYTDFNQGLVLPMPLDLGISVALSTRQDAKLVVKSSEFEGLATRELSEVASGHWTDYLLGAVQQSGTPLEGVSASVSTTLPVGASVSSSAAVEVAMLRALRALYALPFDDVELAKIAQKVENEFVGVSSGLMDQMVISVGEPRRVLFFDTQSGDTESIDMLKDVSLLTIHSGITRKLTENAYNERKASCDRAAADMGVESLRDATFELLSNVKDDDDRIKARHVIAENDRVRDCVTALKSNDAVRLGQIMYEGHASLSQDFEVSKPEMDAIIDAARDAGAIGARMTGAGFGGCVIILTKAEDAAVIKSKITSKFTDSWLVSEQRF